MAANNFFEKWLENRWPLFFPWRKWKMGTTRGNKMESCNSEQNSKKN